MIMPYPEYRPIARITSKGGRNYDICRGYDDEVVGQLVAKSKEEEIVERCPGDSKSRFASEEAFRIWLKKGRILYPLLDAESAELSGIIWLGAQKFTGEKYEDSTHLLIGKLMTDTYAIRTYQNTREHDGQGKLVSSGIARPFTRTTVADYATMRLSEGPEDWPTFTGVHLETDGDNERARYTYQNLSGPALGFMVVGENPERNRVAMALPAVQMSQVLGINVAA
ncbi:MAG TPA: hypothetical protein VLA92_04675 [Candidatus Saccharimonadales bacterium]|nr:hypothetical protein [Candidatus Saccharimonadales bacterium]